MPVHICCDGILCAPKQALLSCNASWNSWPLHIRNGGLLLQNPLLQAQSLLIAQGTQVLPAAQSDNLQSGACGKKSELLHHPFLTSISLYTHIGQCT